MIVHNNQNFIKYIDNKDILLKIKAISKEISKDFRDKDILFLGVLNGSVRFMMNILENLTIPYQYSFIKISSYNNTKRGEIKLDFDVDEKHVRDKHIIIVEDIIDSGKTVKFIIQHLRKMSPESLKVLSLLVKKKTKESSDYYGFKIDNKFVIGYGLDINNLFRDLNHIYIKKDEEK
jgi:hypoxanthine phosphoribosyltransferase